MDPIDLSRCQATPVILVGLCLTSYKYPLSERIARILEATFYDNWMDPAKNAHWAYEIYSEQGWYPLSYRWSAY